MSNPLFNVLGRKAVAIRADEPSAAEPAASDGAAV